MFKLAVHTQMRTSEIHKIPVCTIFKLPSHVQASSIPSISASLAPAGFSGLRLRLAMKLIHTLPILIPVVIASAVRHTPLRPELAVRPPLDAREEQNSTFTTAQEIKTITRSDAIVQFPVHTGSPAPTRNLGVSISRNLFPDWDISAPIKRPRVSSFEAFC